jgi:hypothetical protein
VSTSEWSRRLGGEHGQRDRAAAREVLAHSDAEHVRHLECVERWPSIVAAMKSLVANYNEGAGVEAIMLVDGIADHRVTFESSTNGHGSLVVELDGADAIVRERGGPDQALSGTKWVSLSRTDDDAAAYLLRDWMERR